MPRAGGIEKLVRRFKDRFDLLVLTRPPNLAYAVGVPDALGLVIDLSTGHSTLYVPRLDYSRVRAGAPVDKVVAVSQAEIPPKRPGEELLTAPSFLEALKGLVSGRIASDSKEIGADVSGEIMEVRAVKDEGELAAISEALRIAERTLERLLQSRLAGMRERDAAALAYKWMIEEGADGAAFDPILASGPNGAYPHYRFGDRKISYGDYVVIDIGARKGVYCSDTTRTLALGGSGMLRDAMYAVYEAVKAAERAARDGALASEVDRAAREVISEYGFAQYFIHSTGHGVGVEVHEPPRLYAASREALKRGNVITIEPGVYIEGVGGVRIEDMFYIDAGAVRLNRLPRLP
ncbi:MAG: aminopeptidase P family protein [Thermoproteaceae archaeon]|nr:aminopeptidase P family protein [Thermoproteaceae archaeon]